MPRFIVAVLGGAGEAVDQVEPRGGQLGGAAANLVFEVMGIAAQMVVVSFNQKAVAHSDNELGRVDRFR